VFPSLKNVELTRMFRLLDIVHNDTKVWRKNIVEGVD
jgi:hypothetical protein